MPLITLRDRQPCGTLLVALLGFAALPMLCLWVWPAPLPVDRRGQELTHMYTLLEIALMLVCVGIAAVAWNAHEHEVPRGVHLHREGSDEYQDYWYAKPMPEAALTTLLTEAPRAALVAWG